MVVINASTSASGLRPLAAILMGGDVHFLFLFWKISGLFGHKWAQQKMPPTWRKRKRGTLMLLDKRIGLVVKLYGEVSHKSLKRAVNLEGFGAVIFQNFSQDIQALFLKAWGFPRDTQEGPVYVFIIQCVWVYLLFVVWTVPFHASLPALEMLLGFLLEGVRCQILSVPEHNAHEAAAQPPKASSPTLPLLSMLSPHFRIMPGSWPRLAVKAPHGGITCSAAWSSTAAGDCVSAHMVAWSAAVTREDFKKLHCCIRQFCGSWELIGKFKWWITFFFFP